MAKVMVFDFGTIDNTKRYRVNGERSDLERLLKEMVENEAVFEGGTPIIENVHKGLFSVFLKLKLPVGAGINAKNQTANVKDPFQKVYNNI